MSASVTEQEINSSSYTIVFHNGKPLKLGKGTLNRAGLRRGQPKYECSNCKCKRYTPCKCMKKEKV